MVIDKINKDIQEHLYDKYPKNFGQKRLGMEKKQLRLMIKLEKRRYKKWNSLNVSVAKRLTTTRDINQGREIVSAAVEEQVHEIGYMPSTLPKEIFTEENDNR